MAKRPNRSCKKLQYEHPQRVAKLTPPLKVEPPAEGIALSNDANENSRPRMCLPAVRFVVQMLGRNAVETFHKGLCQIDYCDDERQ